MSKMTVDLTTVEGPVYTGRHKGEALRSEFHLDEKEAGFDVVEVVIPESAYTVSSSFFLGLFGPSVLKCGSVDSFERKFQFRAPEFLHPVLHRHASLALQGRSLF